MAKPEESWMAKDFITLFRMVCGLELRNSFWNFPFMFWATLDRGLLKVKKEICIVSSSHILEKELLIDCART